MSKSIHSAIRAPCVFFRLPYSLWATYQIQVIKFIYILMHVLGTPENVLKHWLHMHVYEMIWRAQHEKTKLHKCKTLLAVEFCMSENGVEVFDSAANKIANPSFSSFIYYLFFSIFGQQRVASWIPSHTRTSELFYKPSLSLRSMHS